MKVKVGDAVILITSAGEITANVRWMPSNGSIHVENDTHRFRLERADLFKNCNTAVLCDDEYTVECKVGITFSENQNVMLHNRWKASGSTESLEDWIISLTA